MWSTFTGFYFLRKEPSFFSISVNRHRKRRQNGNGMVAFSESVPIHLNREDDQPPESPLVDFLSQIFTSHPFLHHG